MILIVFLGVVSASAQDFQYKKNLGAFAVWEATGDPLVGFNPIVFINRAKNSNFDPPPQMEIKCSSRKVLSLKFAYDTKIHYGGAFNSAPAKIRFDEGDVEGNTFDFYFPITSSQRYLVLDDAPKGITQSGTRIEHFVRKYWYSGLTRMAMSVQKSEGGTVYAEYDMSDFEKALITAANRCEADLSNLFDLQRAIGAQRAAVERQERQRQERRERQWQETRRLGGEILLTSENRSTRVAGSSDAPAFFLKPNDRIKVTIRINGNLKSGDDLKLFLYKGGVNRGKKTPLNILVSAQPQSIYLSWDNISNGLNAIVLYSQGRLLASKSFWARRAWD